MNSNIMTTNGNQLNAQVDFTFDLLYNELDAIYNYDKESGTSKILVMPEELGEPQKKAKLTDFFADSVGVLNSFGINIDVNNIKNNLEKIDFFDKLDVKLSEAFLYIEKSKDATKSEYAFSIAIEKGTEEHTVEGIAFKKLSLNIWNTARKSILEKMDMLNIDEILNNHQ